jgi:adenylyltransferase/sulfurtransferase
MSLSGKRVLVIGVGGLGSPAAMALARAGVGTIALVDDDAVDVTNLHRQILFGQADVGQPKVDAAARTLSALAPGVKVETHATRFVPANAADLVATCDLVVEGSDNFATKFLAADACALARVPIVHAAAVRWHGTVLAVAAEGRPCYRCLFEDLPRENAPNCAEAGVIGPLVGVIGGIQASLAIAQLERGTAAGTLITFDGKTDALRRRSIAPRSDCALCGAGTRDAASRIARIEMARYVQPAPCADFRGE